jgi:hypothetical protein
MEGFFIPHPRPLSSGAGEGRQRTKPEDRTVICGELSNLMNEFLLMKR